MNTSIVPAINPMTTSFKQLRQMVRPTVGKILPHPDDLRKECEPYLFCYENGNLVITVFRSGFCIYQDGEVETVLAVDRCKEMKMRTADYDVIVVGLADFLNGPCLIPLMVLGGNKEVADPDDYERYWMEFADRENSFSKWGSR